MRQSTTTIHIIYNFIFFFFCIANRTVCKFLVVSFILKLKKQYKSFDIFCFCLFLFVVQLVGCLLGFLALICGKPFWFYSLIVVKFKYTNDCPYSWYCTPIEEEGCSSLFLSTMFGRFCDFSMHQLRQGGSGRGDSDREVSTVGKSFFFIFLLSKISCCINMEFFSFELEFQSLAYLVLNTQPAVTDTKNYIT